MTSRGTVINGSMGSWKTRSCSRSETRCEGSPHAFSLIYLLCFYLFILEDAASAHFYGFCTLSLIGNVSQKVKFNSDLALAVRVWIFAACLNKAQFQFFGVSNRNVSFVV